MLLELLLELRDLPVLVFGDSRQVTSALGLFHFGPGQLKGGSKFLDVVDGVLFAFPLRFERVSVALEIGQLLFQRGQAFLGRLVFFLAQSLAFNFELKNAALERFKLFRHRLHFGAQFGGSFVHQIDGLVRQKAVRDVAMRELSGRHQRAVLDANAVMQLVTFAQTAQNGDGIFDAWLVDHHRLKTALQSGILSRCICGIRPRVVAPMQ